MPQQIIHPIDIETVELRLSDPDLSDALVDELYRFGQIMFSEMLSRAAEIDRKITNLLGWSIAALGFLLLQPTSGPMRFISFACIAAAFVAVAICAIALKTRMWATPSELDWFEPAIQDAATLRRYHVVSMLVAHQNQTASTARKANLLRHVERVLFGVAAGLTILALSRLAS